MQHCILSFISKENAGIASVGVAALPVRARASSGRREESLGESDRDRKLHDT
jgi:hypothetical protein